jgi:uncharacterized protein (TIGR02996 family)
VPSERAALIAAILAAPQDDAVRLIGADWFEEQGDEASIARAEFIRTQVRRASLSPGAEEQSELQARELRLLKKYGPIWCGSHFVFKRVRFRRGFIEYVHLNLRHFQHHRRQMFALEPIRDISLTGWAHVPPGMARRLAACDEWRNVETLRIYRQGPDLRPRGDVVELLESPHLTRLRSLQLPLSVHFDGAARRRFERLAALRRIEELTLPPLPYSSNHPGAWLSDGGEEVAQEWEQLKSLELPYDADAELLRRLSATPFWGRLTKLSLPAPRPEGLEDFAQRMPAGLSDLNLRHWPVSAQPGPLIERLANAPLQRLCLSRPLLSRDAAQRRPPGYVSLAAPLHALHAPHLREFALHGADEQEIRALAGAPALRNLLSLDLRVTRSERSAILTLLGSASFRSLVCLRLSGTRIGPEQARAMGQGRLRALDLSGATVDAAGLRELLAAPALHRLTWLCLGNAWHDRNHPLDLTPELATELTRLPNLAALRLDLYRLDPRCEQILSGAGGPAWFVNWGAYDKHVERSRVRLTPNRLPPVDEAFEGLVRFSD